jgi:F-type H+-transporting ATPase subunit gamma
MATLREVRRRIAGVKSTQKITKAMKMVAVAKLRRAQMGILSARPYAQKVRQLLEHLLENADESAPGLLTGREVRTVGIVAVTADRGLCGAFNTNVIRTVQAHLEAHYPGWREQGKVRIYCIGKKGVDLLAKRGYALGGRFVGVYNRLVFAEAQKIARTLVAAYQEGTVDRLEIVYNEFKSVTQQKVVVEQFLPLLSDAASGGSPSGPAVNYIYEPSRASILEALLPRHLNFQVWRVLLESNAAEQGARMTAMENASRNASELIEQLQLQYNKARQALITKELLEIVSGAEALRQEG